MCKTSHNELRTSTQTEVWPSKLWPFVQASVFLIYILKIYGLASYIFINILKIILQQTQ